MQTLKNLLKLAFAAALLYFLFRSDAIDLQQIRRALSPQYFPWIFLFFSGALFLTGERFRVLLQTQGVHLSVWSSTKLFLIGLFFNFALPGGLGGDVVKAYYLKKDLGKHSRTSPYTVIFDRFIGLMVMMLMATTALLLQYDMIFSNPRLFVVTIFIFGLLTTLILITVATFVRPLREFLHRLIPTRWGRVHSFLTSAILSFEFYSKDLKRVAYGFGLTLMAQTFSIAGFYLTGVAAGANNISLLSYFFVVPIGLTLSAIPIAPPGGIGVGQAAFLYLFNIYLGYNSTIGPTVITVNQFISISISSLGLYFYLVRKKAT